jgi:hypothetical protein
MSELTPDDVEIGDELANTTEKNDRTYEVVGLEHGKGFSGDETDVVVQHPEGRTESITERHLAKNWEVVN